MEQADLVGANARTSNAALNALVFLIGDWKTIGTHPADPGKQLSGTTSFAWHEDGAFLIMRNQVDEPGFPDGVAIIGSDQSAGTYSMVYFDERGVSRIFDVVVGDQSITWRRNNPNFAQCLTIVAEGKDRLVSSARMSEKGGVWKDDLSQIFTRED